VTVVVLSTFELLVPNFDLDTSPIVVGTIFNDSLVVIRSGVAVHTLPATWALAQVLLAPLLPTKLVVERPASSNGS